MKLTLILKNKGTANKADILLNVSYFILKNEEEKIESLDFNIVVSNTSELKKVIDISADINITREITIVIKKTEGNVITQKNLSLKIGNQEESIEFSVNKEIDLIPPKIPSESVSPNFVYGRLLDKNGIHKMEDIQIILLTKENDNDEFKALTSVRTEPKGYFSFDYPDGNIIEAVAQIGLGITNNPIPIKLNETVLVGGTSTFTFPKRIVLVAEPLGKEEEKDEEKDSDCGCNSLNIDDKRVLEEFSHFSLIRTSEPEIQGYVIEDEEELTLEDLLKNLPILGTTIAEALTNVPHFIATVAFAPGNPVNPVNPPKNTFHEKLKNTLIKKTVLNSFLKDEKSLGSHNVEKLLIYNETEKIKKFTTSKHPPKKPLGRVTLSAKNIIDWDFKPTVYQTVEVAYGHLLQFKTEWVEDGYSPGDLKLSLPLAPGQKKQIVVFDWERKEAITNTQRTDFEESLSSSLKRDRDILEVATGTVSERLDGRSSATTAAIAGGMFGSFFGIAGGVGHSRSNATQNSLRNVAASDSQRLRDSINQSANAIRSLRSTVVQTTTQGERFEVSSESVANYNHCHAITIQYYEVLRHLKVRQRFSGARECLFVPLIMTTFDLKKALRWKESLQSSLLDKSLAKALDAGNRIEHRWEESDFPDGTFASENINSANGFFSIKIEMKRPADDFIEVTDEDRPEVRTIPATRAGEFSTRETIYPYKKKIPVFNRDNWDAIKDLIGDDPENFYNSHLANVSDKDAVFHRLLGGEIARNFVDKLKFEVLNETNGVLATLDLDPTMTSRYHRNKRIRVSIKTTGKTNIKREDFHYLKISTSVDVPYPALIQSGLMKYKTDHYSGFLFNYKRISDDISKDDAAHIYTGPSQEELRNPRKEDVALTNQLLAHLNDNLEHYHSAIWMKMTPQRRYMLLDGIILNGKGQGRSVASLVENELLTIVGNSMVFPVAPGLNLNPDFGSKESLDEFYHVAVSEPLSISIPTKGVYAESVMGNCNSCEEKDESKFWRWEESPIPDSPTTINSVNTDSRRAEPNFQTQQLPNPIVNIQNTPNAPDPTGLAATIGLLGKGDTFRDVTGLELNQKNALAAFQSALSSSEALAKEGAKLEVQKNMKTRLDTALSKINSSKSLSPEKKSELTEKAINAFMGGGADKEEKEPLSTKEIKEIAKTSDDNNVDIEANKKLGNVKVTQQKPTVFNDSSEVQKPQVLISSKELTNSDDSELNPISFIEKLLNKASALGEGIVNLPAEFFDSLLLNIIKGDLQEFSLDLKGASLIPMRKHDNAADFLTRYGGWTNTINHIYINMDALKNAYISEFNDSGDSAKALKAMRFLGLVILQHEITHIDQFIANNNSHPKTFEKMTDHEFKAYPSSVKFLEDNKDTLLAKFDIDLVKNFERRLNEMKEGVIEFNELKITAIGDIAKQKLIDKKAIPATLNGKKDYKIVELYTTKLP